MANEILIYGTIGASWWDEEYVTSKQVRDQLAGLSGDVTVRINSGGGIAAEGQAIYAALVDHPGKVTVVVDAVAASAASLIAMAGDEIIVRQGAWILIHDPATPWTMGRGTEEDHRKEADALAVIGNAYADVYAARAGISREEARQIMRAETYLDGPMAVDMGFATAVDTETQAVAAASFDYRIYAHAPEDLRKASERFGRVPEQEAVMAMIAGRKPRFHKGEPLMAAKMETAAPEAAEEQEIETTVETTATEPEVATQDAPVAAIAAERDRVRRIMEMSAVMRMGDEFARQHVTAGTAADAVMDLILEQRKGAEMSDPMVGRETARVLRDERDTRKAAMTDALSAQMRGKEPETEAARPFMAKSLVEIAAICADWKGPIRTAGDRVDVFMAASHSRSDFSGIFENALNKSLLDRYQVAQPTFKEISRRKMFNDFRVHPMVRPGDFPKMQPVNENGEIKYGTFGEKRETAALSSYAVAVRISRQMMIDDDLGAIDQVLGDYGSMIADFEEETFYANMASATLASDGLAVFHATHGNLAASGSAITVASMAAAKAAIRKQTTIDGKKMNLAPSILLVGPDKEVEALQLVTSIVANDSVKVNPFTGTRVIVSAQITGNTWYMFADPATTGAACFVHGYLTGSEAPRVRMDEPFGTQGMAISIEHDFGFGAIDYRGAYKNPGA